MTNAHRLIEQLAQELTVVALKAIAQEGVFIKLDGPVAQKICDELEQLFRSPS